MCEADEIILHAVTVWPEVELPATDGIAARTVIVQVSAVQFDGGGFTDPVIEARNAPETMTAAGARALGVALARAADLLDKYTGEQ